MGRLFVKNVIHKTESGSEAKFSLEELDRIRVHDPRLYEFLRWNLSCEECKVGKIVPKKIKSDEIAFITINDTHLKTCDHHYERLQSKESETIYKSKHDDVVSQMEQLFDFLRYNRDYEPGDNRIGQRNLKYELNKDDYSKLKVFYGLITVESLRKDAYLTHLEIKGTSKRSETIKVSFANNEADKLNINLNDVMNNKTELVFACIGTIGDLKMFKGNVLKISENNLLLKEKK